MSARRSMYADRDEQDEVTFACDRIDMLHRIPDVSEQAECIFGTGLSRLQNLRGPRSNEDRQVRDFLRPFGDPGVLLWCVATAV